MSHMSHVFISYVREDQVLVDQLAAQLRNAGVQVWLDREQIQPGERWQLAIARAIEHGAFFIACFSQSYEARLRSYMNEEITLAIDELRKRPSDRAWFIPVLLTEAAVPNRLIGAGETLHSIQWLDLHRDWDGGLRKLLAVVAPASLTPAQVLDRLTVRRWSEAEWSRIIESLRRLLRSPRPERTPSCTSVLGSRCCEPLADTVLDTILHRAKLKTFLMDEAEFPVLAERIYLVEGGQRLKDEIADRLNDAASMECDDYRLLASLPIARYVTANFDDLLFSAIVSQEKEPVRELHLWHRERSLDFGTMEQPKTDHVRPTHAHPLVYHLFGHVSDPDSMILSDGEFRKLASNLFRDRSEVLLDVLHALAADGLVLLLGFHSQDRYLREFLDFTDASLRFSRVNSFAPTWVLQLSPWDEIRYLTPRVSAAELVSACSEHFERLESYYALRGVKVFWGTPSEFLSQLHARLASSVIE